MHPSKVSDSEKSQLVNETLWQYYGTPGSGGNLSLTWSASALPSSAVSIELWGYEETGEPPAGCSQEGKGIPSGTAVRTVDPEGEWAGAGAGGWREPCREGWAAAPSSLSPGSGLQRGQSP